jgi:TfoX N-terminal domain
MFGGIAFMVDEKMCVGISRDKVSGEDRLMARVGPGFHDEALKRAGVREMDFVGKPMTGFVFIHAEGYTNEADLQFWVDKTLEYNKVQPARPPKKKLVVKPPRTVTPMKKAPPKPGAPPLNPLVKAAAKKAAPASKAKPAKKTAAKKK